MNNLRDDDFSPKVDNEGDYHELQNDGNTPSKNYGYVDANQNNVLHSSGSSPNNSGVLGMQDANLGNTQAKVVQNAWSANSPNTAASFHKAKVMHTPTNLPPASANTSTGALSKEEMDYLGKISDQNYFIKKRKKKSTATQFDYLRPLSRVRRLYSLTFATRYYGFPPKAVKKMRDRMGSDKSKIFGAAARRAKNLVLSLVMIVAIVATLGTGAIVAILAINSANSGVTYSKDGLLVVIVTQDGQKSTAISNYALGMWQGYNENFYIKMKNQTGGPLTDVNFYIMLSDIKGEIESADGTKETYDPCTTTDTTKNITPTDLEFYYEYNKDLWKMSTTNNKGSVKTIDNQTVIVGPKLTYIGKDKDNNNIIENSDEFIGIINRFKLDIASFSESNKWAGLTMTISFVVEVDTAVDGTITN